MAQEALVGVTGVNPRFERVAANLQLFLLEWQRLAGGDAQLPFDEVLPVIISVTGCSTCRRVFISMK